MNIVSLEEYVGETRRSRRGGSWDDTFRPLSRRKGWLSWKLHIGEPSTRQLYLVIAPPRLRIHGVVFLLVLILEGGTVEGVIEVMWWGYCVVLVTAPPSVSGFGAIKYIFSRLGWGSFWIVKKEFLVILRSLLLSLPCLQFWHLVVNIFDALMMCFIFIFSAWKYFLTRF